jgi:hypothetical protein
MKKLGIGIPRVASGVFNTEFAEGTEKVDSLLLSVNSIKGRSMLRPYKDNGFGVARKDG